ncbi:MAG: hypothetical protein GY757_14055, partial [bacterium]|nr:hypothetical protein [bacterium]
MAEPEFDFDYDKALKYYLHYDFLPRSVMARFIVKRNKEIKNRLRWRTGVVLENRDLKSTAVVKVDERDKKLPKTDGDHYFKVENIVNQIALQKQEVTQHVDVKQETNVEITIDIKVELPAIQENFADLKKLLVNQNAG